MTKLVIWTDGCCLRPIGGGPGGWAFVAVSEERVVHIGHGADPFTTNNRMEMVAAIEALGFVKERGVIIMSDSRYLVRGVREWMLGWSSSLKVHRPPFAPLANVTCSKARSTMPISAMSSSALATTTRCRRRLLVSVL